MDKAQRTLFDRMAVAALCFADPAAPNPTPVRVIVTDFSRNVGDLKGTNFNYAELRTNTPQVEFLISEIEPYRQMFVSVEPGVAYQVDTIEAASGLTVVANVIRLKKEKTTLFPVPQVA
jgi:hypothetical protein